MDVFNGMRSVPNKTIPAQAQWLATAGLIGVGAVVGSAFFLHLIHTDWSPLNETVSHYMNGTRGWMLGLGVVALGLGSLALVAGLQRTFDSSSARTGRWALAIWGVCIVLSGLFPPGHRGQPRSLTGSIHANAATVGFLAFPIAAVLLARALGTDARWTRASRVLRIFATACVLSLAGFFVCLAPVFSNRQPYFLGLSERIVLAFYLSWLWTLAWEMRRMPVLSE